MSGWVTLPWPGVCCVGQRQAPGVKYALGHGCLACSVPVPPLSLMAQPEMYCPVPPVLLQDDLSREQCWLEYLCIFQEWV